MNRIQNSAVYFKLRQEDASSAAKPSFGLVSHAMEYHQFLGAMVGASAADIMGM